MKNKSKVLYILFFVATCISNVYGQKHQDITDGPYISAIDSTITLQWIKDGEKHDTTIAKNQATIFHQEGLPQIDLTDLTIYQDTTSHFHDIEKWSAISDVHGQYDLLLKLLKSQGIINDDGQWDYGTGHLVVVGDVFDRGPKVTESFWLLYRLDKEARKAGGRLHMLLGNHELMVMHKDLEYINPKYKYTQKKLKTCYSKLYGEGTVLGDWLRSKPVSITINDVAFVHAGYTKEVLTKTKSISNINKIFRENFYTKKALRRSSNKLKDLLYYNDGPLWYRGYANPAGYNVEKINEILNMLGKSSIVVGHTSMPQIVALHDNRIFLIDSSIKFGKLGEMLMYDSGVYYRANNLGVRVGIDDKTAAKSPFEYVYQLNERDLKLSIETDVKRLIDDKKMKPWQPAKLTAYHNNEFNRTWNLKLRARGQMRKKLCPFPPIKLDFAKSTLKYLGFSSHDDLKLVIQCTNEEQYEQNLIKEYLCYKLYDVIDSLSIRVRLIDIELKDSESTKVYDLAAFCMEDDLDYQNRLSCDMVKLENVHSQIFNNEQLINFNLFQLMILNNDWNYYTMHNVKVAKSHGEDAVRVVPYDFDFASIVSQPYALYISRAKYIATKLKDSFEVLKPTTEELLEARRLYLSKKNDFLNVIESDSFLNKKSKQEMTTHILEFYKLIENDTEWAQIANL